jgi:cellobiose-specific phosphotransferase system component IIB
VIVNAVGKDRATVNFQEIPKVERVLLGPKMKYNF